MDNSFQLKLSDLHSDSKGHLFFLVDANEYLTVEQTALKYIKMAQRLRREIRIIFYAANLVNRLILFCLKLMYWPNIRIDIFDSRDHALQQIGC